MGSPDRNGNRNKALADALHEIGEPATPEELSASGIRRVRRVSRELVSRLIEKAVNRTLMERTIGVPDRELRELIQRAHDEFDRIVGHQDEIGRTREQIGVQSDALKEELGRIRAEIAERHRTDARRSARARDEVEQEENDLLGARLRAAFDKLETRPPEIRRLEREVHVRALEIVESARDSALDAGRAESRGRIEALERRITKLVGSLQVTERALGRVARMEQDEVGLESIYRTVQGLDPEDSTAAAKRRLMHAIFEKNLDLHRQHSAAAL